MRSFLGTATFIIFSIFNSTFSFGQGDGQEGWEDFSKVKFVSKYFPEAKGSYYAPLFGKRIKQKAGQEMTLKGYVMPFEYDSDTLIILSKYPFSQCYFCGKAGPESVAEIVFSEPLKRGFHPDALITVSGTLQLNKDDINHLNFILKGSNLKEE